MSYEDNKDFLELIKLTEYLCGYGGPSQGRLRERPGKRLPMLATPLVRHLNSVNRFLFDGGITVDIPEADIEDPRQQLLDLVTKKNSASSQLSEIWRRGAISGEVCLVFFQGTENDVAANWYKISWYDRTEFEYELDASGELKFVLTQEVREIKEEYYIFKTKYDNQTIISYKPQKWTQAHLEPEIDKVIDHGWGIVPAQLIKNHPCNRAGERGDSEFDYAALDMATEIAIAYLDTASNHHFFGQPIYLSVDPEHTLEQLRARVNVLQKYADSDGGPVELLSPVAMPESHRLMIEDLEKNLADHLGSSWGQDSAPPDTSSVTLRLLNAKSISTAEARWQTYVIEGLQPFLGKILIAAAVDGVVSGVNYWDESTYCVEVRRKKPYFPESPIEKGQLLSNAANLTNLGIKPEVALRDYFPSLTDEQILELMSTVNRKKEQIHA